MPTYEAITPLVAHNGFTVSGDFSFATEEQLKILDGVVYADEDFIEFMEPQLILTVRQASGIRLSQSELKGQLLASTYFETSRELNESELMQLRAYYDAQMSDGIGENFLARLRNRADVEFRLEVWWLYDSAMGSRIKKIE